MKKDEAHKLTDETIDEIEKRVSKIYREASEELTETINQYFASFKEADAAQQKLVESGEITASQYQQWKLSKMARGQQLEQLRDKVADRYTNANEVATAYINNMTPKVYSLNRNYVSYNVEQAGINASFAMYDEQTVKRLIKEQPNLLPKYPKDKVVDRAKDIAYSQKQVTSTITSAILQGKSIDKIGRELQGRMENLERNSAIRAARTAMTSAQNAGRIDGMKAAQELGIKLKKEWLATLDNRTRHEHALLDGQAVDVDEPFEVNGDEIMYPGDPDAEPYLTYNCRCTLITQIDKQSNEGERWSRDPETNERETVDNTTYQEWYEQKTNERKSIESSTIGEYNNTISKYVDLDVDSIYQDAKEATHHAGIYKDAMKHKKNTLEKSISSHTAQVKEHAEKIANPSVHDSGWDTKDERAQNGLVKKWQKDMKRNAEQATIEIEVWKERFGK